MVTIQGKRLGDLTAIYHMALALERWFPNDNGVFAYGTRLLEEIGELSQALQAIDRDPTERTAHHLIKETEDVLQIITGILGIYSFMDTFPTDLNPSLKPKTISKDSIIQLVIQAGLLANAINHIEGQGIKKQKHGLNSKERLLESATVLTTTIASFLYSYDLIDEFEKQITLDYLSLSKRGLIN